MTSYDTFAALLSVTPLGVAAILAYHSPAILDRLAVLVTKVTALVRVLKK